MSERDHKRSERLRRAGRPSVVLLLEDPQGGTMAVRFPDSRAAQAWEDAHPETVGVGIAQYVSDHEALARYKGGQ